MALVPGELTMQRFWVKWAPSPGLVVLSVGCTLESPGELKNQRHLPSTSKDFHFIGLGGGENGARGSFKSPQVIPMCKQV